MPCPLFARLSDGQEEKLVLKRARHADDAAFAASVAPSGAANFLKSGTSFTLNAFVRVRSVSSSTEGTSLPLACRPVAGSAVHHPLPFLHASLSQEMQVISLALDSVREWPNYFTRKWK